MVDDLDVRWLVDDLDARIARAGDPAKRDWWQRYLKHALPFHGVGIPTLRGIVAVWRSGHDLEDVGVEATMALATAAMARPVAEDKLAAIVLLQEHALDLLRPAEDLATVASWFDDGHVADWNTCDWLCVRVLGPTLRRHGHDAAGGIASWVDAPGLWRRRAAGVAFVDLAPHGDEELPGLTDLVLGVCRSNVRDPARFAQTGVGWVLRELSVAEPALVASFVAEHVGALSREAIRSATAVLDDEVRARLLDEHADR